MLLLLLALACTCSPQPELPEELRSGEWRTRAGTRLGEDQAELLAALGYAEGGGPLPARMGVVSHDPQRAWQGLNLVVSGDAPRAHLMTMDGQVVHTWERSWQGPLAPGAEGKHRAYWRRARLLPDGGLLVLHVGQGIVRLDRDSEPQWTWPARVHHDVRVVGDQVWTLTLAQRDEGWDNSVAILDLQTGALQREVSLYEALRDSHHGHRLSEATPPELFHANSVVPDNGQALVTVRELDALVWLDLDTGLATDVLTADFDAPHEAQPVGEGHLLLFDNLGRWPRSQAVEIDHRGREVWAWDGGDQPIASRTVGSVQRLPGGNTLVVSSNQGRATEVTPEGEVVWDWYTTATATVDGQELVANLFDVTRIAAEDFSPQ